MLARNKTAAYFLSGFRIAFSWLKGAKPGSFLKIENSSQQIFVKHRLVTKISMLGEICIAGEATINHNTNADDGSS